MTNNSLLLVDDEPLVRESLAEYLSGIGYDLTMAENETEAYNAALASRPGVIISDLMLGHGSGLSLFSKVKREMVGKDEPCCILMTGFGTVQNAVDALHAGVDDYLLKPFNLGDLDAALKGGLARKRRLREEDISAAAAFECNFQHDVSAPLTVLQAYVGMFTEGCFGALSTVQENKMEVLKRNMNQVIKVLDRFDYRGADPLSLRHVALNPAAVLRDVQNLFFLDFERRGVNVVMGLPAYLPRVKADRQQTSMLMEALIGNCLANATFGMTLRIRWIQNADSLDLQLRLEPWPANAVEERGFLSFDPIFLGQAGLRLESQPEKGIDTLTFLHFAEIES